MWIVKFREVLDGVRVESNLPSSLLYRGNRSKRRKREQGIAVFKYLL